MMTPSESADLKAPLSPHDRIKQIEKINQLGIEPATSGNRLATAVRVLGQRPA
jgi:hypothetical protein